MKLLCPVAGKVLALSDVPDPVFSGGIMGPGLGVYPSDDALEAFAPVSGTIAKIHPHAFVIETEGGRGVLVHLGLNTVEMNGEGFTVWAADGDHVEAGQRLISWDPAAVRDSGRSPVVPVVAMQADPTQVEFLAEPGFQIAVGAPLLMWN
jgi:PTS system N-acetylglucosamine-specific IIA component